MLAICGEAVQGMRAHPSAARVAEIAVSDLTKRRFSRSKAEYLIGAAQAVASGRLDAEALTESSAVAAERSLLRLARHWTVDGAVHVDAWSRTGRLRARSVTWRSRPRCNASRARTSVPDLPKSKR